MQNSGEATVLILSILFGSIVGVSLGLTGGGGAIFAVPMLAYGLGLRAREAVAVSLISVGSTSLVGFLGKWRRGEAEIRTGLLFAAAGMAGAPVGTWIAARIPDTVLMLLFAVLMLTIAARMWLQSTSVSKAITCLPVEGPALTAAGYQSDGPDCRRDSTGRLILSSRCAMVLVIVGIGSGILSGMFGIGGGFIIVPALVMFSQMSMSRAVGTSLMVISLVSVSGIVSQWSAGQSIPLAVTSCFAAGGLAGLSIGQHFARQLSVSTLQRTFSVAILCVAGFVIFRTLRHF